MMKVSEITCLTFKAFEKERRPMVVVEEDSDFCQEVVGKGWLTREQMAHAAERYRLGKSKSGRCIFWMIDEMGIVRDGHIGDSWASLMLKAREPKLLSRWHASHCLYGLHLLTQEGQDMENGDMMPVAIVEKESSAVILSEVFPECIWLATVYPMNFNVHSFEALQGHNVTLYPTTDETMDNYFGWLELADQARRAYGMKVTVQDVLEQYATAEQKATGGDLLNYIFEV